MKECFLQTHCSVAKVMLHSQSWLQHIMHRLCMLLRNVHILFCIWQCTCRLYTVHLSSRRMPQGHTERKKRLSRGKETLVAQLWHRCSKMLYRLLTHSNRHLHKASCSASVAFRDATVNCLSLASISLSVLLPQLFIPTAAALWLPPLCTSFSYHSHLSS